MKCTTRYLVQGALVLCCVGLPVISRAFEIAPTAQSLSATVEDLTLDPVFAVKKKPSAKRGKKVFTQTCRSCHAEASRFGGLTKTQFTAAQKSVPEMAFTKPSAAQLKDLLAYLKNPT